MIRVRKTIMLNMKPMFTTLFNLFRTLLPKKMSDMVSTSSTLIIITIEFIGKNDQNHKWDRELM